MKVYTGLSGLILYDDQLYGLHRLKSTLVYGVPYLAQKLCTSVIEFFSSIPMNLIHVNTHFKYTMGSSLCGILFSLTSSKTSVTYFYSKTNQMRQFVKFILFWNNTTCCGRSFRPSSGVQDCTYSTRSMSDRDCCLLASKQATVMQIPKIATFFQAFDLFIQPDRP